MSDELHALLARASNEIEVSAPALEGGRLGVVRSEVRRRRIVRRAAESFAGVGVVGVLGVGLWFGLDPWAPEPVAPVVTPTIAPTPTPTTPTPTTPTRDAAPTGPVTREESIDDATVLARLGAPRTGEVWHAPTLVPDVPALRRVDGEPAPAYLVGTRGEASIYLTAWELGDEWHVDGLFEVGPQGARLIACPSARTADACADEVNYQPPPGVVRDVDTFYDTLTLPATVDLGDGFTVTTTNTAQTPVLGFRLYGDAAPIVDGDVEQRVLRDLGPVAVVAQVAESPVTGLTNLTYGFTTPFGTFVRLDPSDVPGGEFAAISWDDGVVRTTEGSPPVSTVAPGSPACRWTSYSQESAHVPGDWRPAGTTPSGHRVYVPVAGGNSMSRELRAWHEENSSTLAPEGVQGDEYGTVHGAAAGYPYTTDEAFLQANALFAMQGPAGEWLLGMRSDAANIVYECA
ncbi:hypothetical protein [Cellulomonas sp. Leaf395]|uniref:hypothetical protein n=1 Tax=Cellulomonas sp. Leaf395 TaxID=1736362 RepID=UPI0006F5BEDC|nr:hypothetical protein [Cellulomonas sp. Leaf395]KQT01351.1 hypothetical protein ASG23_07260 [Cellulomonas sp. Leaf395]